MFLAESRVSWLNPELPGFSQEALDSTRIPHGFHTDSTRPGFHTDSTRIPHDFCGFSSTSVDSPRLLWIPHGFHTDSTRIPHGFHKDSTRILHHLFWILDSFWGIL